jgi:hypothetical protein
VADYPPFMNAYGNIPKILTKITEAKTPDRFTQDFLGSGLGFTGGSSKAFIPLLKRIGLLSSDGVPTELYHRFRNNNDTKRAMADAMKHGFSTVFARNEYAYKLDKSKLQGLITEITGLDSKSTTLRAIVETWFALREFADFEAEAGASAPQKPAASHAPVEPARQEQVNPPVTGGAAGGGNGLRFAYTIYLNLPNTDNIAVFNAIFKSLKENLPLS